MVRPETKPPTGVTARIRRFLGVDAIGQRLVIAASVAGVLVGLIAIAVPLIAGLGTRTSSASTVEVEQAGTDPASLASGDSSAIEPLQAGFGTTALGAQTYIWDPVSSHWAVPVEAPWGELWSLADTVVDCKLDSRIEGWLDEHGTRIRSSWLSFSITNTATDDSQVVLSDIRPQGELSLPVGDTIKVGYTDSCPSGGGDDTIYGHITIGVDPVAIYDSCYEAYENGCYFASEPRPVAGEPLVFAIRPGEFRGLAIEYDQVVNFQGRFVATVTAGGERSTIELSNDVVATVVTRTDPYLDLTQLPNTVGCVATGGDEGQIIPGCSLDQWRSILEAS